MADGKVRIQVDSNARSATADFQALDKSVRKTGGAAQKGSSDIKGLSKEVGGLSSSSASASIGLGAMATRIAAVVAAFQSAKGLITFSDAITELETKIANVTNGLEEQRQVYAGLRDAAQRSSASVTGLAEGYVKLNISLTDNLKQQFDLVKVTELLARGFAAAGASAQTQQGTLLQITQGLATNFSAAGQELNSLLEGAPLLANVIAKELGLKSAVEIKKLAEAGKLTSEAFLQALVNAEKAILAFDIPPTIGNAWTRLKNTLLDTGKNSTALAEAADNVIRALNFISSSVIPPLLAGLEALYQGFDVFASLMRGVVVNSISAFWNAIQRDWDGVSSALSGVKDALENTPFEFYEAANAADVFFATLGGNNSDKISALNKQIGNLNDRINKLRNSGGDTGLTKAAQEELTRLEGYLKKYVDQRNAIANSINGTPAAAGGGASTPTSTTSPSAPSAPTKEPEIIGQFKTIGKEAESLEKKLERIGESFGDSMIDNLVKGQLSFKSFAQTAIGALQDVAAQLIKTGLGSALGNAAAGSSGGFSSILNTFAGFFGGGVSSASAKGNVFTPSGIQAFASGGIVSSPTLFGYGGGKTGLMGEAGAEAIMPLRRTSSGDLGVQATPANINVYNQSGAQIETIQRPDNSTDIFIRRMNSALASERTSGAFNQALSRTQTRGVQAA